jgi:putative transposase
MAEGPRMTAAQLADKLLASEHADVLRQSVAWIVAELMEAEVTAQIGAELGQRTPDRLAQRNGYRPRAWDTRVGELELRIPRLRTGSYFPSFLEPRRRAEQALVAVVQEAYVNGVSTRRVDRLVEQLGIAGMSKDQVSRLCRGLDEQVRVFRERPLEGRYPYLWLDANAGCAPAASRVCGCASPTPTRGSRPQSPRSWAAPGNAAPCISCGTCSATSPRPSSP